MLAGFLLALREGIEAALIVGIVLGLLRKMNRTDRAPIVWLGVGAAALVSLLAAAVINLVGARFEGAAEEAFEGVTMLLAAGVLTWMIFWMQKQGRQIQAGLEADVKHALARGTGLGLFLVPFFAVVREGIELALFLTASALASDAIQTLTGAVLGLAISVLLGWLLFTSTLRLNLQRFFQVTGFLLILFAAGLVAHGVHEFNEVGWIPALIEQVWNLNPVLDENSTFGALLKALFGYNGNPSLTEVLAYLAYFVALFLGLRSAQKRETLPMAQAN